MDKKKIIELLSKSDYSEQEVKNFANYCERLITEKNKDGSIKNGRAANIKEEKFADLFSKVKNEGLVFDGIHITLQATGISYDYVAYKNKMLNLYPESVIDIGLIYNGDEYNFEKTDGKVIYEHKMADPFKRKDENIIGAYVVIKNKRGEFLTTLTKEELDKHRKVAKTDYIRKMWYVEMCMKTIMKKACKLHYGDVFTEVEIMDNNNYDLEKLKPTEEDVMDGFTSKQDGNG